MDTRNTFLSGGLAHALGAYTIWGLLPLYMYALKAFTPAEMIGWRILLTFPLCLGMVFLFRQVPALKEALANRRTLLSMTACAILLGGNWFVYTAAIQEGHVFAASLGYYINPIFNVLLGTLFLKEKLSKRQWISVALAAVGVSALAWGASEMLWISLTLAITFAFYGLLHKITPSNALAGLTIESAVLVLPAIGLLYWLSLQPLGLFLGESRMDDFILMFSGALTALPLLLFSIAAQRMDYSTLGFCQFLSPTIVFFLGLFVFHETLKPVQIVSFALIWVAIGIFTYDLIATRKKSSTAEPIS